jgi:hypothetical protein
MERVNVALAMQRLLQWLTPRCPDHSTMDELTALCLAEPTRRKQAHDLFNRIRRKTSDAAHRGNQVLAAQYRFEEACAKTLYNLSGFPAPFDADSPYWIIPNAITLARVLQLDETEILRIIAPESMS